jgi:hypothetical protein
MKPYYQEIIIMRNYNIVKDGNQRVFDPGKSQRSLLVHTAQSCFITPEEK